MSAPGKRTWVAITALLLLLHIILFGTLEISDPDAWCHAMLGRLLLEHGRIPAFSDYSWMTGDNTPRPFVCGIQIILYLVLHHAGYHGLLLLRMCLLATVAWLMWRMLRQHGVPWPLFLVASLLFMTAGYHRFLPRGDFFNLLFFIFYLCQLEKFVAHPRNSIWLLPLLQAVWSNIHQLSVLGVGLVGLYIVHSYWQGARRTAWRLLPVGCMCVAALFATPAGYLQFVQTWQTAGGSQELQEITSTITEFMPLSQLGSPLALWHFWLSVGLVILLALRQRQVCPWHHLLLWLVLAWGSWRHVRLIALFALLNACLIARLSWWCWLAQEKPAWLQRGRLPAAACLLLLQLALAISLWNGSFTEWNRTGERCRLSPNNAYLPVESVRFLQRHSFGGNIYTDYAVGGYVGYHLPSAKIFMHSLCLYYALDNHRLYLQIAEGKLDPTSVILPYGVELFVINHSWRQNHRLTYWLYRSADWLLVYADESTVIFASRDSPWVRRHGFFGLTPEALRRQQRIAGNAQYSCDIGLLLLDLGFPEDAEAAARQALDLEARNATAHNLLGMLAVIRGEWEAALRHFIDSAQNDARYSAPRDNIRRLFSRHIVYDPANPWHRRAFGKK